MSDEKRIDEEWKEQARKQKESLGEEENAPHVDDSGSEATGELPPASFSLFVSGLATQALLQMGAFPNPISGKVELNLAQAKYTIDILGMLEDKTRGNLSDREKRELDQILYDLRIQYVQAGTQRGSE